MAVFTNTVSFLYHTLYHFFHPSKSIKFNNFLCLFSRINVSALFAFTPFPAFLFLKYRIHYLLEQQQKEQRLTFIFSSYRITVHFQIWLGSSLTHLFPPVRHPDGRDLQGFFYELTHENEKLYVISLYVQYEKKILHVHK